MFEDREVRVMQNAVTVLNVLRERGRQGLPLARLYRQLFNPALYLVAYGRIYSNKGAMTAGVDGKTADGMHLGVIDKIIEAMRHERYRFKPARRMYIPKRNGKRRPLGLPSWSDKLVGEVVRLILEAFYEPVFSDKSHGFRAGRGCHTALSTVMKTWNGTAWFIEGDIADCFGSLDHEVMIGILGERIHDNRFLTLVRRMLRAGYLEDWRFNATLSGAPQGGVVSPILSNIYLDKLDTFVETVLIPEYTRGVNRARNRAYVAIEVAIRRARRHGDRETVRQLHTRLRRLPSADTRDPGYRRLRYVRYADDHLLGFAGPKHEAEQIKQRLARFLRDELKLELSQDKTLITHARTRAARFLGYEITVQHSDHKITNGRRSTTSAVGLRVPRTVIKAKCSPYMKRGKAAFRPQLTHSDDLTIINTYGAEFRGLAQYYMLAGDVYRLTKVHWVMRYSLLKTLARKHRSTATKMAARYDAVVRTPYGPRKCFEATRERGDGRAPLVARFGGIPLKQRKNATIADHVVRPVIVRNREVVKRLVAGRCEVCKQNGDIRVHQIRKLADLDIPGVRSDWMALMVQRRRKTLMVCQVCHDTIHGRPDANTE
jgi:group II intron reverse transcriptase/maturase